MRNQSGFYQALGKEKEERREGQKVVRVIGEQILQRKSQGWGTRR